MSGKLRFWRMWAKLVRVLPNAVVMLLEMSDLLVDGHGETTYYNLGAYRYGAYGTGFARLSIYMVPSSSNNNNSVLAQLSSEGPNVDSLKGSSLRRLSVFSRGINVSRVLCLSLLGSSLYP